MNTFNMDVHEDQVWALGTVGDFRNKFREITAHQPSRTTDYSQYNLLNAYVLAVSEEDMLQTVWNFISQDVTLSSQSRKQIILNTLGEYYAAAQACQNVLNCPTITPVEKPGYNNKLYYENARIVSEFRQNFAEKLNSSLQKSESVFSGVDGGVQSKIQTTATIKR